MQASFFVQMIFIFAFVYLPPINKTGYEKGLFFTNRFHNGIFEVNCFKKPDYKLS